MKFKFFPFLALTLTLSLFSSPALAGPWVDSDGGDNPMGGSCVLEYLDKICTTGKHVYEDRNQESCKDKHTLVERIGKGAFDAGFFGCRKTLDRKHYDCREVCKKKGFAKGRCKSGETARCPIKFSREIAGKIETRFEDLLTGEQKLTLEDLMNEDEREYQALDEDGFPLSVPTAKCECANKTVAFLAEDYLEEVDFISNITFEDGQRQCVVNLLADTPAYDWESSLDLILSDCLTKNLPTPTPTKAPRPNPTTLPSLYPTATPSPTSSPTPYGTIPPI